MGLKDWFRGGSPHPPFVPAGRRFHVYRERMFDLDGTHRLAQLFAMPKESRDAAWQAAFWECAWTASVALTGEPQVFTGPDGFPYLRLDIPTAGAFEPQCLANVAPYCLQYLHGAAFFAGPDEPPEAAQYVLSLGLIDSLLRYDSPDGDPIDIEEAALPEAPGMFERVGGGHSVVVTQDHDVLIGTPSADYLPPPLARSLYLHLTQGWGVEEPRVQLVVDRHLRPHRALMIGCRPGDFPPDAPLDDMVQRLIWHLDPSRQILLAPDGTSVESMTPLRELFEGSGPARAP